MKKRRRRDEREPVRVITQEWVENNCTNITPRDMEMLKLLAKFPLLSSEHLRILTPGAGGQKPFYELSQGQKRCNERIRVLYDLHCVNKWSPRLPIGEGTSKQYVALDRAGCKLLNIERRVRNEIPQDWRHKSMVMDVYCELVVGEREGKWEIKFLEYEPKQISNAIKPDVAAIIRKGKRGVFLFIEVDRSEKKESVEKQKLRSYRDWQLSQTWMTESWASLLPRPIFPVILYLFDESKKGWKRRAISLYKEAERIGLYAGFIGYSEFPHYLNKMLE